MPASRKNPWPLRTDFFSSIIPPPSRHFLSKRGAQAPRGTPRWLNPCPTVERVLLILFFLTCFEAMKHSTCFILIAFAVKNVLYILNITCYILFFVYLWSCIVNQAISFQLICMKIKCMYIDDNTLHAHFLFFFLIITKKKRK